jgi:cobalt-zinc-cadmium efflux system membrane fusion protein
LFKKRLRSPFGERAPLTGAQIVIGAAIVLLIGGVAYISLRDQHDNKSLEISSQSRRALRYTPTDAQWATLKIEPVGSHVFRAEHITEGKIAVDEDRSTPIFSPYAGRVTKLLVKPGDEVQRGQPLFVVEATDMVQAQSDFIAAVTTMNKARSRLNLAQIVEKRNKDLYEGKAVALKEWQNAQAELVAAQNDMRSAEVSLEAARNRLRILGRSDSDIAAFEQKGIISPETPIYAPIGGTIVQRKIGPGQYVSAGSSDPVFVIGDLSAVWLLAYVRESEAPNVHVGQAVHFKVLAYPDVTFPANISYVATALDSATRRLLVRATVINARKQLKPEMFASVTIQTGEGDASPAVPRGAVIYEGDRARVWVVLPDKSIEMRNIETGLVSGPMIQVLSGVKTGDQIITHGSLFIDRAAAGT